MPRPALVLYVISATIATLAFTSCENSIEKIRLVTDAKTQPVESMEEIELLYSDSAIVKMKLTAPKMERFDDGKSPYVEMPDGMKVVFFDDDMQEESHITANYARRYETDGRVVTRDDVVVLNKKGEQLNTEQLIWDEKKRKLFSDEFVKITTANEIIYGEGLVADEDFLHYEIKNIKGTVQLHETDSSSDEAVL